ncbi:MAG: ABC-F family ATP-binding cassette domain-containing protein [Bacteroidales bacterium]|nr:ABC-F family ATP-binding cassette domain-containing protein [Bacteroidales bacterium]MDD5977962.1 ABC-F family ATP-binding cassette domain-containing protein [Bacteroidales bacterium]MDY6074764.1 ABC-F family ATP-binding cassette domain-containing protein [Bacteroidales bacterium]
MNYLSVENLSKAFSDKLLFENLSFGIEKGDKTALIAENGTGKTTLMRILVGKEEADGGKVVFNGNVRVGYLEQLPTFDPDCTIGDVVAEGHTDIMRVIRKYEDSLVNRVNLEEAMAEMDANQAWDYEMRLKQLLSTFEINDLSQKIGTLSGGQVKRLALALVLLDNPDILFLDEPTNHLDMQMVEWLEDYLSQSNVTLFMVTHDRYFLDRVCNKILEMYHGVVYTHKGNFDYYVRKSREREENKRIAAEKAGQMVKRELEWIRATPQARTGKSRARIDAFFDLKEKAKMIRDNKEIQFGLDMQRLGGKILEMKAVSKRFDDQVVLNDFDYVFKKGERIGIIGKNGVGKSTFLNMITGSVAPDSGTIVTGETVVYGYYHQSGIVFDENKSVLDTVREIAEVIHYGKDLVYTADKLLAHFMFPYSMHRQPVALLSGGEKRRLYLLTILIKNPNFLILDEPTNDLDILTLQKIEDFLKSYKGCLIVVSHDRFFLDQTVDQLFVFEGDGSVKGFMGNYSQYHEWLEDKNKEQHKQQIAEKSDPRENRPRASERKKKRSFAEQKEYEQLSVDIQCLENEKLELASRLENLSDYVEIDKIGKRLNEINALLDEKEMRWLELDEI